MIVRITVVFKNEGPINGVRIASALCVVEDTKRILTGSERTSSAPARGGDHLLPAASSFSHPPKPALRLLEAVRPWRRRQAPPDSFFFLLDAKLFYRFGCKSFLHFFFSKLSLQTFYLSKFSCEKFTGKVFLSKKRKTLLKKKKSNGRNINRWFQTFAKKKQKKLLVSDWVDDRELACRIIETTGAKPSLHRVFNGFRMENLNRMSIREQKLNSGVKNFFFKGQKKN